jgi:hypothetical protein
MNWPEGDRKMSLSQSKPIAAHGLQAFSAPKNLEQLVIAARSCVDGRSEISVSDKCLGPIGLFVAGELSAAYREDVYSWIEPLTGERAPATYMMAGGELESLQLEIDRQSAHADWLEQVLQVRSDFGALYEYVEGFMRVEEVVGVWVTGHLRSLGEALAAEFGVELVEFEEDDDEDERSIFGGSCKDLQMRFAQGSFFFT